MLDEELLLYLARIALPTRPDHSLEALAAHYNLSAERGRDLVEELLVRLVEELASLPPALLDEANWLLAQVDTPLREIFAEVEREATKKAFGAGALKLEELLPDFSQVLRRKPKRPTDHITLLETASLSGLLRKGGRIAELLPGYEERQPQTRMLEKVARALNQGSHLMIEAGTGTGKSLAYLLPAIEWALANKMPVVVSTNTKNLQSQLWDQDIPLSRKALEKPFDAALIKGRANYLCLRKLLYTLRQAQRELSEEERAAMLPILTWLMKTRTGDIAENTGFLGLGVPSLWEHLFSSGPDCPGRHCRYYRSCFLMKARALALSADLIVANHALVFSELTLQSSAVLPKYYHIVLDEAQNIEDVATDHLAVSLDRWRLYRPLRRLFRHDRTGAGTGLIPTTLAQISRATALPEATQDGLRELANHILEFVIPVEERAAGMLAAVEALVSSRLSDDRIRYEQALLGQESWQEVIRRKEPLISSLGSLISAMGRLQDAMEGPALDAIEFGPETLAELRAQSELLQQISSDIEFLLRADDPDYVYWAERRSAQPPDYRLAAAPLDISRLLYAHMYEPKRSVILSSATLTSSGSFDYLKNRLGLAYVPEDRIEAADVGTTFDYPSQCRVLIPTFLPEPRDESGKFAEELAGFLAKLCPAIPGGTLVLFTSYQMLNEVQPPLARALPKGTLLLAQGLSGSREQIARLFQRNSRAVLMGTHSFWEGVDFPGQSLSCLVIAKLPFHVHTDPVVEARCELLRERGQDPFLSYSLPYAVLRFRQGFGRLIRRKEDKGVIVVCDKRVVSKRYGSAFLRSLPAPYRAMGRREDLIRAAAAFLKGEDSPSPRYLDRESLRKLLSQRRDTR